MSLRSEKVIATRLKQLEKLEELLRNKIDEDSFEYNWQKKDAEQEFWKTISKVDSLRWVLRTKESYPI